MLNKKGRNERRNETIKTSERKNIFTWRENYFWGWKPSPFTFLSIITSYLSWEDNNKFMFILLLRRSFFFELRFTYNYLWCCLPLTYWRGLVKGSSECLWLPDMPCFQQYLVINCYDSFPLSFLCSNIYCTLWDMTPTDGLIIFIVIAFFFVNRDEINQLIDWIQLSLKINLKLMCFMVD